MRMFWKCVVLQCMAACFLVCGPYGVLPLSTLLAKADAVVVATVSKSEATETELSFDLNIIRVIKGEEHAVSSIHATFPSPSSPLLTRKAAELQGQTGIWFLSQLDSKWTVLPLATGDIRLRDFYIPVPTENQRADVSEGSASDESKSPSDKLIKELKAAARNPDTASGVHSSLQVADKGLGSAAVLAAFSELSRSPDAAARVAGVSGLLRNSAPGAATALAEMRLADLPDLDVSRLASGLCRYRGFDTTQLVAIESLVDSSYPLKIRSCAVHALREIHTLQTLPTLEQMLDDVDAQIRYDAVIGIAQFAFNMPIAQTEDKHVMLSTFKPGSNVTADVRKHFPIQSKFESNEQEYISFWKEWMHKRQSQSLQN